MLLAGCNFLCLFALNFYSQILSAIAALEIWHSFYLLKQTESISSAWLGSWLLNITIWQLFLMVCCLSLLINIQFSKEIKSMKHVTYLFRHTVIKNCYIDQEKCLKFEAEGREFVKLLRSLEQCIQTVKGQNNFW